MAVPACTLCGDEPGMLMATSLESGDTMTVGEQCYPAYALALAEAATQGMPSEAGELYGPAFDAVAANDPRPATTPAPTAAQPSPKSKRATSSPSATNAETDSSENSPGISESSPEPQTASSEESGAPDPDGMVHNDDTPPF